MRWPAIGACGSRISSRPTLNPVRRSSTVAFALRTKKPGAHSDLCERPFVAGARPTSDLSIGSTRQARTTLLSRGLQRKRPFALASRRARSAPALRRSVVADQTSSAIPPGGRGSQRRPVQAVLSTVTGMPGPRSDDLCSRRYELPSDRQSGTDSTASLPGTALYTLMWEGRAHPLTA